VRRLRLERRLSQERLAELAGLSYKHVGRIELAHAEPGADVLVRLARALAVPVGELFETITPTNTSPGRLSPSDVDSIVAALAALTAAVDRVVGRQPRPVSGRSPRQPGRSHSGDRVHGASYEADDQGWLKAWRRDRTKASK
jgi:transcriptional regulator with XRE-family HTH domain